MTMPAALSTVLPSSSLRRCLGALSLVAALAAPALPASQAAGAGARGPASDPADVPALLTDVAARFDAHFAGVRADHAHPDEPCLTPLLGRVRAAAPLLSNAERERLAELSPVLEAVLTAAGPGVAEAGASLPDYPDLTASVQGKQCVVHYTLTGQHAAPDESFVKLLAKLVDQAVKAFGKDYKRPFFEPDRDGADVLHVFVIDTATVPGFDDAVMGFVNPTEEVPGDGNEKALTTWMAIDHDLVSLAGAQGQNWKKSLKATVFHEYYHCVQLAHNAYMASWGLEGQAVWTELRYAKIDADLYGFLERPDSLVNMPELPIWDDGIRKYSTAPLWAYCEQRLGKDALQLFWAESASSNDPISVLEAVLFLEQFSFFDEFWADFAGRLVAEDIKGLNAKKLPDLKRQEEAIDYGWTVADSVPRTGIMAYQLVAPTDKKTDLLFVRIDGGVPAVLVHDKNKRLELSSGLWNSISKFKKPKEATLILTSGDYEFPDDTPLGFSAQAFAPYLKVHDVDWGDPVPFNETAMVTFTYDLLCVPAGATFPVAIYRRIKGKKLDVETQLIHTWPVGLNQTATVSFDVDFFPPQKQLSVQMNVKVPPDAPYGGEHAVSKHKGKVKVLLQ